MHHSKHITSTNAPSVLPADIQALNPINDLVWEQAVTESLPPSTSDSAFVEQLEQAFLDLNDYSLTADSYYDAGYVYAFNTETAVASDAASQTALAAEINAVAAPSASAVPWKAIGSALLVSGVGAAAGGGGGGSSSGTEESESIVESHHATSVDNTTPAAPVSAITETKPTSTSTADTSHQAETAAISVPNESKAATTTAPTTATTAVASNTAPAALPNTPAKVTATNLPAKETTVAAVSNKSETVTATVPATVSTTAASNTTPAVLPNTPAKVTTTNLPAKETTVATVSNKSETVTATVPATVSTTVVSNTTPAALPNTPAKVTVTNQPAKETVVTAVSNKSETVTATVPATVSTTVVSNTTPAALPNTPAKVTATDLPPAKETTTTTVSNESGASAPTVTPATTTVAAPALVSTPAKVTTVDLPATETTTTTVSNKSEVTTVATPAATTTVVADAAPTPDVSALNANAGTAALNAETQFIASNIPTSANYVVVTDMSSAAAAVAADSKLTHVLVSDGVHFALFSKGNTAGHVTASWSGSTWGAKFTDYVPVSAFINNGTDKNITTALQSALNLAAKLKLGVEMPHDGQYTLTDSIKIHGEVPFLHGNGSTVSVNSTGSLSYAFRLGGIVDTHKLEFSDLTIDMNGLKDKFAIWGKDVSGANLHHLKIIDASYTAISLKPTDVGLKNITIADNIIDMNWNAAAPNGHFYGIGITNPMESSSHTGQYGLWQQYLETGAIPKNLYDISSIKISGNQINGGYYGIYFSGVSNSEISDNLMTNNVRNISLQNNSSGNTISGNYLTDQMSSAVHIAYNSNNNIVKNNTVTTYTSNMQALIQAYQDSDNNQFIGNNLEVLGSVQPGWALYSGTDSDGTKIANNIASGTYRKTAIGVEAIWDNTSANAQGLQEAAMMSSAIPGASVGKSGVVTYNGGMGSVSNISVTGNIIDPNFKRASVIYAGADVSNGYDGNQKIVGNINNLNISNNVIFGTNGTDFTDAVRLHENGASITGLTNKNNSVLNGSNVDNFAGTDAKTTFFIDSIHDKITDTSDTDNDMVYSSVSYTLPERVENLMLIGSEALNGTGNSGNNVLTGNGYANVLNGGAGDDILSGGLGHDTLTGGAGKDIFLFDSVLREDSVDTITDFKVGEDQIGLSSVIFGKLTGNDWFAASASQVDKDTVVFQDGNKLFYDADGSGDYFSPVQFAELNTNEQLSTTSFQIF